LALVSLLFISFRERLSSAALVLQACDCVVTSGVEEPDHVMSPSARLYAPQCSRNGYGFGKWSIMCDVACRLAARAALSSI